MVQNKAISNLINKYRENKLAHAYLIETNNLPLALSDLKELVKILNCPEKYQEKCAKCNLCNLISKENLPSLKIINPDGANIKKNQIETLKIDFSTIPIYSKFNTYIINNAEKLNSSSANSLLKFLEEPTPGIEGFFLTTNRDIIIETIKSRCQLITAIYDEQSLSEKIGITSEEYMNYLTIIPNYLSKINTSKNLNNKKELLNTYQDRKDIENIFKIIFELYYNKYLKEINQKYDENLLKIYEITDNLSIINKKMQIISQILQNMSYNVNIELILDKFVIEMRGANG